MIDLRDREILFEPPLAKCNKPSLIHAIKMAFITLHESAYFLLNVALKGASVELTDHHIWRFWRRLLRASHTTLEVVGRSKIDLDQSHVYMSNHLSLLDIPVLFGAVPQSFRMVAKAELFSVPVFGKALAKSGFIRIDRADRQKAIMQLEAAKDWLKKGTSVWIAPEGTRSRTTEMGPFKKGGFHIAVSLGKPIIPVWIEGSAQVIHADSSLIHPNLKVTAYFGEPISTEGVQKEDLENLMTHVRKQILALSPPVLRSIEK